MVCLRDRIVFSCRTRLGERPTGVSPSLDLTFGNGKQLDVINIFVYKILDECEPIQSLAQKTRLHV